MKFGRYPFMLDRLASSHYTTDEKAEVCAKFVQLPLCCLGTFSRGLRKLYPTARELGSRFASATISSAMTAHRLSTDFRSGKRGHSGCGGSQAQAQRLGLFRSHLHLGAGAHCTHRELWRRHTAAERGWM